MIVLVLVLLLAFPPPAHAHAGGLTPRDQLTEVVSVDPPLPGVGVRMVNHGTQLEIRNDGTAALPIGGRTVKPGETSRFRDDRTTADRWDIALGTSVVHGRTTTFPPPNTVLWLLITVLVAGSAVVLSRGLVLLGVGTVVVAGANVAHAFGSVFAVTGGEFLPLFFGASGVGLVCWPLAVLCLVAGVRRRPATAFVAAIVGAMLVVAGVPDFDSFRFSQLPFAWSATLDRALVAATLGGGLALAIGGFARMRRDTAQ
ncbi:hypothetical protein Lesp02_10550 [Lentzea sp. NBRC 105346]|uniref:hypothetical protein n=1 Tax=Lentzea sp. NBRC 105346 TaxID=3032205 RepID=UPI0024A5B86B|nr:hypothetical protein [Lentzea sp. NBRC 105346]GLZ28865.1 hypothetical protein Lesp02_10550 [Lentzea sp. NBRC 105346]